MNEILLGRQPVFDRNGRLFAYELLCRDAGAASSGTLDGDRRTAAVVLNAFIEVGLDAIVGRHRAFVRMTPRFLEEGLYRTLPARRVVLTLELRAEADPSLFEAIHRAADQGYSLAVDRYEPRPEIRPLLPLTDFARIDLVAGDASRVAGNLADLRHAGVRALAYRVEDRRTFEVCREAGFDLFQGFFFCRPDELRVTCPAADLRLAGRLLADLSRPDADLARIGELIQTSPELSRRILRAVNAALAAPRRRVSSIRHALALLGIERTRDLVSITLLADSDAACDELTHLALVRAETCRRLARRFQPARQETFFTVGLLSVLDALLGRPMEEALAGLPLDDEVKRALLERRGPAGLALDAACSCEGHACDPHAFASFGFRAIRESHLEAIRWARDLIETYVSPSGAR